MNRVNPFYIKNHNAMFEDQYKNKGRFKAFHHAERIKPNCTNSKSMDELRSKVYIAEHRPCCTYYTNNEGSGNVYYPEVTINLAERRCRTLIMVALI